jgi:hypothetical protein
MGDGNTCIGSKSGHQLTGGTYNTFIGFEAGYPNTTGTNNTCIGRGSTSGSLTVSNTFTLGDSAITVLRCAVQTIIGLSDERDKTNVQESAYGLDLVKSLKPVTFEWDTRDGAKKGDKDLGFIAQDLQSVDDEYLGLVYAENPERLEASYGRLIPVLVKAIQELTAKVEALENK